MKTYKVTLITKNTNKSLVKTEIPKDLLEPLVNAVTENGEEQVHTTNGTYIVTGVVIGDVKGKVLIL